MILSIVGKCKVVFLVVLRTTVIHYVFFSVLSKNIFYSLKMRFLCFALVIFFCGLFQDIRHLIHTLENNRWISQGNSVTREDIVNKKVMVIVNIIVTSKCMVYCYS